MTSKNTKKDKKNEQKAVKISVDNNRILENVSLKKVMESLRKLQSEQEN